MSVTADQTWSYRFHDLIQTTFQQDEMMLLNKIDPMMVHRDIMAQVDFFERLGNVMANDVISPFGQTVRLNPAHSRRAVRLQSSDATVGISDENTLRGMVNPTSPYTFTVLAALRRRSDKHVINALTGTAETAAVTAGSGTITFGTQALPSARIIGGATAMDLARVINANELLSKAGCPSGANQRILAYSPGQLRDILAITQASSSDFTKNQIHDRGTINGLTWQGFLWIEIPDVVREDATTVLERMLALTSTTRRCIAFHRSAVGISIGKEITTTTSIRHDLNDSIQVRPVMAMGAGRVWEGGVVAVDALEN